jgi:EmrB/QacA subfamily drug resistance transporter
MLMNALDGTIVNVALPAIQRDLHFSQANLTWVVDAFLITFGSFLLLAGRLGDLLGRKRVFLTGVAIFTLSSATCATATNQGVLIAARFVQGLGGAVSSSVIIAIIVTEFTNPLERAKAMSAYVLVAVSGGSIGLLVGGALTEAVNWHWIFIINLPIGAATFILGAMLIANDHGGGERTRIDYTGSLLVTAALMLIIYGIIEAGNVGWGSARTYFPATLGALLLVGFFALEARLRDPIMPFRILRIRSLTGSSLVRAFVATGMFSAFFIGALNLEHVLNYSPLRTGLAFLPATAAVAIMSSGLASRLMTRFGAMQVLIGGMVGVIAGMLLFARAGIHANYWTDLFPAFAVFGVGCGASFLPLLTMAMADVPSGDAGLASGIVNVSMQMGAAVGLAVLTTLAAGRTKGIGSGHSHAAALLSGYHLAYVLAAAGVVVGSAAALVLLADAARRSDAKGAAAAAANQPPDGQTAAFNVVEF